MSNIYNKMLKGHWKHTDTFYGKYKKKLSRIIRSRLKKELQ